MDVGFGEAAPVHADDVESHQIGKRTLDKTERDHIGAHPAQAHDHRAFADAHELAHRGLAAEYDKVADSHVAAQHNVIGEGHVVTDHAVVSDMRTHHQKTAISYFGDAAAVLSSRVHGDTLADVAIGADHQPRRAAAVFDGLRWRSERGKRIKHCSGSDHGVASDMNVSHQPTAVADHRVGSQDAIRPDRHVLPDRRARLDARGWIDHDRSHATMAPTSASATICPPTFASPRNHHMFFFRAIFFT